VTAEATTTGTHEEGSAKHPSPKFYWLLALGLAVVTAVEVAIPYLSAFDSVRGPLLVVLSLLKFGAVVGFFMHLKYENRLLQNFFAIGFVGAIILYLVVLATFRVL
jgi:caa(3)-type oxidase subunit IV